MVFLYVPRSLSSELSHRIAYYRGRARDSLSGYPRFDSEWYRLSWFIFLWFSSATPGEHRDSTLQYVINVSSSILPYQSLLIILQNLIPCCTTPAQDTNWINRILLPPIWPLFDSYIDAFSLHNPLFQQVTGEFISFLIKLCTKFTATFHFTGMINKYCSLACNICVNQEFCFSVGGTTW